MVIEGKSHRETEIACLENKGLDAQLSQGNTLCAHGVWKTNNARIL